MNSTSSAPPPNNSNSDDYEIAAGAPEESKDYVDDSPPAPPPSNSDSSPPPDDSSPSPPSNTDPPETSPPPESSSGSPDTPSPPSQESTSPQSSPSSGSGSGSGSGSPPKKQTPPPPSPPKPSRQQSPPPPSGPSRESSQSPPEKSPPNQDQDSSRNSPSPPLPSPETSKSPRSANSTTTPSPTFPSPSVNGSSPGSPPKALAPAAPRPPKSPSNNGGGSNASSSSGSSNNGHNINEVAIGVAVAGVFIFALLAFFCCTRKRTKRQPSAYANYMPPPANFGVTSDAYMGRPVQPDAAYYNSQLHGQQSNYVNSFGSPGGQNYHSHDSGIIAGSKSFFTYEELMEITNGFARQNVIGEGGFGCVYKGWMPDGRVVAVKQLKAGRGRGEREFRAEVEIISRVHHRHLVSLVGYSVAENEKLLIYEFVPNNTLEHHLHAKDLPVLEWVKRVKIAVGAAKGLAYLHEDCQPKIIHRDIKSANILLDDDFEAQVADFGLARLNDTTQTHVSTRVMGTFGYLAPEYASSGKLTDRSDVYSFGVVLLELITGRKPVDPTRPLGDESLVEWARPLLIKALETGDIEELIDPRLEKRYVQSQMFRMVEAAAACVRHSAAKRPRMALVVRALDFEGDSDDLSNGVKVGQSTVYDSGQYNEEILRFRRLALASDISSEFEMYSGEYNSREASGGQQNSWNSRYSSGDYTSGELETKAFNPKGGDYSGASGYYGGGGGGRLK